MRKIGPNPVLEWERWRVAKKEITVECEEVWREISNYLNDEIEPHLRIAMAAHFKRCAHCTAVLDGTRNVIQLVGGDDRVFEIPAGASQRMYEKFRKHLLGKRR